MAFSSVQFLFVFLPLALAVYWICPKRLRNIVLGAFSLLFFAWAGLKGAAVLVLLACINWLGGLWLGWLAHKKPLLAVLVLLDMAVLGGFKYAGFAAESINAVVPGLLPVPSATALMLPWAAPSRKKALLSSRCSWLSSAMGRRGLSCGITSRPRSWTPTARPAKLTLTASATVSSG